MNTIVNMVIGLGLCMLAGAFLHDAVHWRRIDPRSTIGRGALAAGLMCLAVGLVAIYFAVVRIFKP